MPPANPRQLLHIHRTDGDSSQWPQSITPEPGAESWDYFEGLEDKDSKTLLYLIGIGKAIVHAYEEHPERMAKRPLELTSGDNCELFQLPVGYKLFIHHKKKANEKARTDGYLFGGARGHRFRSPNEFKEHAVALAMDNDGTPYFDVEPFAGGLSDISRVLVANLPVHTKCKLCEQKLIVHPRTVNPREGSSVTTRRAVVSEPTPAIHVMKEKMRAFQSPAFNLRHGELVWVLDQETSESLKSVPSLKPTNIDQRKYFLGMIVGVPPKAITWEQFQNAHPLECMYKVQLLNENAFDSTQRRVKAHFTNVFPYALKPPVHCIDQGSHSGGLLASTTVSFIVPYVHNVTDDYGYDLLSDTPVGYASRSYLHDGFKVFKGLFMGAEKVWKSDMIQVFRPLDNNPTNSSGELAFEFLQISDLLLQVTDETGDPHGRPCMRTLQLQMGGPTYTSDLLVPSLDVPSNATPAYFDREQISEQNTKRVTLDRYMSRYYEPEAIRFWTARHNLNFIPLGITNIIPDREDVLFPGHRVALAEYRCKPRDVIPVEDSFEHSVSPITQSVPMLYTPTEQTAFQIRESMPNKTPLYNLLPEQKQSMAVWEHEELTNGMWGQENLMGDVDGEYEEDDEYSEEDGIYDEEEPTIMSQYYDPSPVKRARYN